MPAAEIDNRHAERARYFAEVDVLRHGTPKPLRMWGENLSEGGIFLQTSHPWIIGERLALRIPIEDERVVIRQAEVAWVRPFEPINVDGRLPGIGVRFLAVDPPYRAAIRQLMAACNDDEDTPVVDDVPMPPPLDEVAAFAPSPPTPRSAFRILDPISLPPTAEPEYTLKGWVLEKAPRALREMSTAKAHVDTRGPFELGAGHDEESMRWQLGPDPTPPSARASRAPVAIDTSIPARVSMGPMPAAVVASNDDAIDDVAHADDARLVAQVRMPSLARAVGDVSIHDDAIQKDDEDVGLSFAPLYDDADSTKEMRRHSTLEDQIPFTRIVGHSSDDDQGTFVPRAAARRHPMNLVAGGLVVALGAVAGVFLGLDDGATVGVREATHHASAPRSVDEAERALHALIDEHAVVATDLVADTVKASAAVTPTPAPAVTPPATVAAAPIDDAARSLLPRKPVSAEPVMTSTVPVTERAPTTMLIERGRVTLPLDAGTVKSAFTLSGPPRVVVDLEEAKLASFQEMAIAEKGIAKIRFGRPNPGTVRVVVELDAGATPRDVTTQKRSGSLAVAWR